MLLRQMSARRRDRIVPLTAVATLVVAAGLLWAGPLDPPAGPVASTYKTLQQVEPRTAISLTNTPGDATSSFKITQPGSYYLAGEPGIITNGKHGILIAASNVTVDLNGFRIWSLGNISGALDGVHAAPGVEHVTVRNGTVHGMIGDGVDLSSATDAHVVNVHVHNNNAMGILVGVGGSISGSTAVENGLGGMSASPNSRVTGCTASGNGSVGISAGQGSTISGCTAFENTSNGVLTGNACTVTGCAATLNGVDGIAVGSACVVMDCTSIGNDSDGIAAGTGCTITRCAVRSNALDGIRFSAGCLVISNVCSGNGAGAGSGAGIHATASDNRIEGNNCAGADRGVFVAASGNIIVKNTCSGNALNWDIAASNYYGTIVNRVGVASNAVSGDSAATTLGSGDANANFSY